MPWPNHPEASQTLTNLEDRIDTAAGSDEFAGQRIDNNGGLRALYQQIGAHSDITPGDGETTSFTPSPPPSTHTCSSGTAVAEPLKERGLVHDCNVLLNNKDLLSGSSTLDWDVTSAIDTWEGVSVSTTPSRVTKLNLADKGLTGMIPPEFGTLSELDTLDLSNNKLTGDIPAEIGWLFNLTEIELSGNSLTGCVPVSLVNVASNDFSSLGLLFCTPPAPTNLKSTTAGEFSVSMTWDGLNNVSQYRVEHRPGHSGDWTIHADTITATSHAVDGMLCGTAHQFRVAALGSGAVYTGDWSEPSAIAAAETSTCRSPVFDSNHYYFQIADDGELGSFAGIVIATDPTDRTPDYSITTGNSDNLFNIDQASGVITISGTVSASTPSPVELTVTASDDEANISTTSVTITVDSINYDTDQDGLIGISNLAQLDAIRFDLSGTGESTDQKYLLAYPAAMANMGCPGTACLGYELTVDLDFDTNQDGVVTSRDHYWNNRQGWQPIGSLNGEFSATFDGNGRNITNLYIRREGKNDIGLFGITDVSTVIRNLGLESVNITGNDDVGALVGLNRSGNIYSCFVTGDVTGDDWVGGLVGDNTGRITGSYSQARVSGKDRIGGLVGSTSYRVNASYATGRVAGRNSVGGLAGEIIASYSTGKVETAGSTGGGLVGSNRHWATDSYWDTDSSGMSVSAVGDGKSTADLQTPTGYEGIYLNWNVDIEDAWDDPNYPWDFGTTSDYPVLKVDFDGNGTVTWEEFGGQRPYPGS